MAFEHHSKTYKVGQAGCLRRIGNPPCFLSALLLIAALCRADDNLLNRAAELDSQQKCHDAQAIYDQLLNTGTSSPALLNNLGYHYLSCGDPAKAQAAFEYVLKINPRHRNANLELARFALRRKNSPAALKYLARLGDRDPETLLVKAEALDIGNRHQAAVQILTELLRTAPSDPALLFAIALTCGRLELYSRAEDLFTAVLRRDPEDYDVLYNLGLAAAHVPDYRRAQHAFEAALKTRPQDVDATYQLGSVEAALHDATHAFYLLAQAHKLAPARADVTLALARAAVSAGYYGDAVSAYDAYLQLQPDDDGARRDRALVLGFSLTHAKEGLTALEQYTRAHPGDAAGFYDLAQLQERDDLPQALADVSTALRLDPRFEKARYYHAWLLEKQGRYAESAAEAQKAASLDRHDARALDLLGLDDLNLERPADAATVLRSALQLAPDDPDVLFHLSKALLDSGQSKQAQPYLDRFRAVKDRPKLTPHEEAGLIEAASLSSGERSARIVQQLAEESQANPADPALKLSLGSALLAAGRVPDALRSFDELLAASPSDNLLEQGGAILLRFDQYRAALPFLDRLAARRGAPSLNLAVAVFFTNGPEPALKVLDQLPGAQDDGDQRLLRARILNSIGRTTEADTVLLQCLNFPLTNPALITESAVILSAHARNSEALELLNKGLLSIPGNPDLLLTRVAVLSAAHRQVEADHSLHKLEEHWPEWDLPYLLDALFLMRRERPSEARQEIEIARALGADEATTACILAPSSPSKSADPDCSCSRAVFEVFFPCRSQPHAPESLKP